MPITYVTLTEDERNMRIAQAIRAREEEHFHYELNRLNYEQLLGTAEMLALPAEWPAELQAYQGMSRDDTVLKVKDSATLATVLNLQLRDRLNHLRKCETLEAGRVEKYHSQLMERMPKEKVKRDKAFADELAERTAAKNRGV